MSNTIKNRSEILFLYDIENANPNGDPNDENRPRIDEETGINIVTDVRLKRTIRDYLYKVKDKEIFVKEIILGDGTIQDGKTRAKDFGENKKEINDSVLEKCIDVRMFGATIPLEKDSITYTGPVQFKMGKSLHSIKVQHIKGTGAFASKEGSKQKTFREEYITPYSLISFYGIANENAAEHTKMTDDDLSLLKEALWKGTKELISRSKFGQIPRLLLIITYKEADFFIGELDNLISLKTDKVRGEEIRKPEDYKIDITELCKKLYAHKEKIEKIEFTVDDKMQFVKEGADIALSSLELFTEVSY